jgi:hypothetical protein
MILKVTETNFTTKHNWLFKLTDSTGKTYFIMNDNFYRLNKIKAPTTRKEIDSLDKGHSIDCETKDINSVEVVIKIKNNNNG